MLDCNPVPPHIWLETFSSLSAWAITAFKFLLTSLTDFLVQKIVLYYFSQRGSPLISLACLTCFSVGTWYTQQLAATNRIRKKIETFFDWRIGGCFLKTLLMHWDILLDCFLKKSWAKIITHTNFYEHNQKQCSISFRKHDFSANWEAHCVATVGKELSWSSWLQIWIGFPTSESISKLFKIEGEKKVSMPGQKTIFVIKKIFSHWSSMFSWWKDWYPLVFMSFVLTLESTFSLLSVVPCWLREKRVFARWLSMRFCFCYCSKLHKAMRVLRVDRHFVEKIFPIQSNRSLSEIKSWLNTLDGNWEDHAVWK